MSDVHQLKDWLQRFKTEDRPFAPFLASFLEASSTLAPEELEALKTEILQLSLPEEQVACLLEGLRPAPEATVLARGTDNLQPQTVLLSPGGSENRRALVASDQATQRILEPQEMPAGPLVHAARSPEPAVGLILRNQFVLEALLGQGGMGLVFKARDRLMEEMKDRQPFVAIKVLRPEFRDDRTLLMGLQREFKKAQKLSHPRIAQMMDFTRDEATGLVFVIMQYLEGDTLDLVIRDQAPQGMPFKQAFLLIQAMGQALAHAHQQGIVHLDFKPANVFVCRNGDLKVLDFGIASVLSHATTEAEQTLFKVSELGALTPAYASPEMLEAHAKTRVHVPDVRDDVYAFACVVYEVLTGSHPFGRASATDARRAGLVAKAPKGLSLRQGRALFKALAFSQAQRLASVEALVNGLKPIRKMPVFIALVGFVALVGMPVWKIQQNERLSAICQAPLLTPEETQRIQDLVEVAQVHMDVGYLTSPPASNAALSYQEILRLDPCNLAATEGMSRIRETVLQQAWERHDQGDDAGAQALLDQASVYIPGDPALSELKATFAARR